MGLVDGRDGRRGRRLSWLAFHRERRDDGGRHLVDDVERLEGRDRRHAAGLRLDDEDLLLGERFRHKIVRKPAPSASVATGVG